MTRQEASGAREPGQAPSHCHQPTRAGNGHQQELQLKQEFRCLWKPGGAGGVGGPPSGVGRLGLVGDARRQARPAAGAGSQKGREVLGYSLGGGGGSLPRAGWGSRAMPTLPAPHTAPLLSGNMIVRTRLQTGAPALPPQTCWASFTRCRLASFTSWGVCSLLASEFHSRGLHPQRQMKCHCR